MYHTDLFCYLQDEAKEVMMRFECSMGSILRIIWNHVEAMQTTDIPMLIEHISEILTFELEVVSVYYIILFILV